MSNRTDLGLVALLATAAVILVPDAASADAAAGKRLVDQWCVACHVPEQRARSSDSAPPFTVLAARGRDPGWLRAWLADPHPPMPNPSLTRQEIEDIVAYLGTLRR